VTLSTYRHLNKCIYLSKNLRSGALPEIAAPTVYVYTFIRHKSRLRKYERKTQTHTREKSIHTSTN